MKIRNALPIICAVFLSIVGCAGFGGTRADTLPSAPEDAIRYQHRIAPGDTIHVTIWEVDQPKEISAQVKKDGTVDLLFMKGIKVAGLSEQELEEHLNKEVSHYYVNPRLSATLTEYVYLMGEVKNPGTYPLDKGRTLVAALAGAGGPTRDAKLRNTLIIRGDYHNNPEVIVSDASRMLRRGDISENVWLQAGDIIYVPSTVISDVNYFITQIVPILDVFLLGAFFGL
jgi:polysaccharide export outer membrane protein